MFYGGKGWILKRWMGISVALLLLLSAAGCAGEVEVPGMERSLFAMNTYMTFTVYGGEAEEALEEAEQLIQKVESLWSVTDEDSEIYQANHSGRQADDGQ